MLNVSFRVPKQRFRPRKGFVPEEEKKGLRGRLQNHRETKASKLEFRVGEAKVSKPDGRSLFVSDAPPRSELQQKVGRQDKKKAQKKKKKKKKKKEEEEAEQEQHQQQNGNNKNNRNNKRNKKNQNNKNEKLNRKNKNNPNNQNNRNNTNNKNNKNTLSDIRLMVTQACETGAHADEHFVSVWTVAEN